MNHTKVQLTGKQADGYTISLGPVTLVNVVTDVGMVDCGAFDIAALKTISVARRRRSGPGIVARLQRSMTFCKASSWK